VKKTSHGSKWPRFKDRVPTEQDFVLYQSLDELAAFRDFGGRTKANVKTMLDNNFLGYSEHFMWMGPVAFCYYADPLIDHVRTLSFEGEELTELAWGTMVAFASICEFRLRDEKLSSLRPCAAMVAAALDWVAARMELVPPSSCETMRAPAVRAIQDEYTKIESGTA
jgi:hypothetical protein